MKKKNPIRNPVCIVQVRHFRGNIHSEEFQQRAAAGARSADLVRYVEHRSFSKQAAAGVPAADHVS